MVVFTFSINVSDAEINCYIKDHQSSLSVDVKWTVGSTIPAFKELLFFVTGGRDENDGSVIHKWRKFCEGKGCTQPQKKNALEKQKKIYLKLHNYFTRTPTNPDGAIKRSIPRMYTEDLLVILSI